MIKSTLTNLWQFIKKPTDEQMDISFSDKLKIVLIIFVLEFFIILPFTLAINYIASLFITLDLPVYYETTTEVFFGMVVFASLGEEVVFRSMLRYRELFAKIGLNRERWNKIFPIFVYITAMLFGFMHMFNFNNSGWVFYMIFPLIVLSQLFGGLTMAFIRVRLNLFWSIFAHAFWNLIFFGLMIIFYGYFGTYHLETEQYNLDSEILMSVSFEDDLNIDLSANVTPDNKLLELHAHQFPLTEVLEGLTEKNFVGEDEMVNIEFESKNGIAIDEFVDVMLQKYKVKEQGEMPLDELIIKADNYNLTLYERGYVNLANKAEVECIKTPDGKLLMKLTAKSVPLYSVLYWLM